MTRSFNIGFDDLKFETYRSMIERIKENLKSEWQEEMSNEAAKKTLWYVRPKSWEEAYCRTYAVGYRNWNDLDEKSLEFQKTDWAFLLDSQAEDKAEEVLIKAFSGLIVEVKF